MNSLLRNITWSNFEIVNENPREAFEDMSRMLFKKRFLAQNTILNSKHNHPGIEVYPVLNKSKDKKISFQSKYFSTSVDYSQIKHSAMQTVKYYKGSLDVFYLFCNKDLDSDSQSFKEISRLLNDAGIAINLVTNKEILDSIVEFPTIASKFFNSNFLSDEWFKSKLEDSLSSIGIRYNKLFNVSTETEKLFQLFLKNSKTIEIINERKKEAINELNSLVYRLPKFSSIILSLKNEINSLIVDNELYPESCLTWKKEIETLFVDDLRKIEEELDAIKISELEEKKYEETHWREEKNLESLLTISNLLSFSQIEKNLLTNKTILINGDAGNGKTQLLSEAAHEIVNKNGYALLLSGHHFLNSDRLEKQIMEVLGLDFKFSELLLILESIGESNCKTVYIFIDAINESNNKNIWRVDLPKLIKEIEKLNFVRLAVSFRSGYEQLVIHDSLNTKIENNELSLITHYGFQNNSIEAIGEFLNYYGIVFSPTYILDYRMTNPLFLNMFCRVYDGNDFDFYELLNKFLKYADNEAQKAIGFDGTTFLLKFLVDEIASYQLKYHKNSISQTEIVKLPFWNNYGLVEKKIPYIDSLKRNGVLLTIIDKSGTEDYQFGYNMLEDFIYAQSIMDRHNDKNELKEYLKVELLGIEASRIKNKQYIDVFIIITSLYRQKFDEECIDVCAYLKEGYDKEMLQIKYMKSFSWRPAIISNKDLFRNKAQEFNLDSKEIFDILIENSVKINHELNVEFLHSLLMKMALKDRDYLWTTYINNTYDDDQRIIQLINFIEKDTNYGNLRNSEESWLLCILLSWYLTSTNRYLRDRASKALIEVLKVNFAYCQPLLEKFETVNDPYVIQRLYGIVFGACMKSSYIDIQIYKDLVKYIYSTIFDKSIVFPDILLRDYARLIIERFKYKYPQEEININYDRIRPPYDSEKIPIDGHCENINYNGGMGIIANSLAPEGSELAYGDFGRYVFQSSLNYFLDIDIVSIYKYALEFIKTDLGYSNELFTTYDQQVKKYQYSRHDHIKIERIGKKYQWIAMYNILARVSDTYSFSKDWADSDHYNGPWNPYVRDFDPTLNEYFLNPDGLPQFDAETNKTDYFISSDSKSLVVERWISSNNPEFTDLNLKLLSKDSDGIEWVTLYWHNQIESEKDMIDYKSTEFKKGAQRIWTLAQGYFVKTENLENILMDIKNKNLYGRWFPEGNSSTYSLFNREFGWAPGYIETLGESWLDYKVETGKYKTEIIQNMKIKEDGDEIAFEEIEEEISVPEKKILARVLPTFNRYLWEEQYDGSKAESISFYVPCSLLLKDLNLEQKQYDGYFYSSENELVAFDRELSGEMKGLVIRKDFLEKFLSVNELSMFWTCLGEKQFFKNDYANKKSSIWSGAYYFSEGVVKGTMRKCEG
ncbi:hypothetical protein ACJXVI_001764 [Enterococcus faecium]